MTQCFLSKQVRMNYRPETGTLLQGCVADASFSLTRGQNFPACNDVIGSSPPFWNYDVSDDVKKTKRDTGLISIDDE